MPRYFIKLAYNGTRYHGWQVQDNAHSVQAEINKALSLITGESIETLGCGRTDTGVHAREFYAHFDSTKQDLNERIIFKMNKILPADIACYKLWKVSDNAHARFDAIARMYEYIIIREKNPFVQNQSHFLYGPVNVDLMNKACSQLFDYIDFSCFSKSKTQVFTNNCKIMFAAWKQENDNLIFTIKADRFLRNMVRTIVGTMLEVGKEQLSLSQFSEIIESKNRSNAGISVPAAGLFLIKVEYPEEMMVGV